MFTNPAPLPAEDTELEFFDQPQSMDYLPPRVNTPTPAPQEQAAPAKPTGIAKYKWLLVAGGVIIALLVLILALAWSAGRRRTTEVVPTPLPASSRVPEGLAAELADLQAEWDEANPTQPVQPFPPVDLNASLEEVE